MPNDSDVLPLTSNYSAKVFMAQLRTTRIAAGLCVQCGAPELKTKRRCSRCADQVMKADRRRRAAREAQGLPSTTTAKRAYDGVCPRCGGPRDCGYITCTACRASNKIYRDTDGKVIITSRINLGLCSKCGEPAAPDSRYCPLHQTKNRVHSVGAHRRLRARREAAGQCEACDSPRIPGLSHCLYHYTRRILASYVSPPDEHTVQAIVAKFDGQCAYSGLQLDLSTTAQLEHIFPKKWFPDLVVEPSNLVWVHAVVNDAKRDRKPDDADLAAVLLPAVLARIRALASAVVRPPPASNLPANESHLLDR